MKKHKKAKKTTDREWEKKEVCFLRLITNISLRFGAMVAVGISGRTNEKI